MPIFVHFNSEILFNISKQFEGKPEAEKLDSLLKKIYTMLVFDESQFTGTAGMNKDCSVRQFCICVVEKPQKLLLNALDRTQKS